MHDTVIIGAGMAGLTAAIYAARKRMDYVIIGSEFGGQLISSGQIANYTGISETTGIDMLENLKKQMDYNDIKIIEDEVTGIKKGPDGFIVYAKGGEYPTRTVIIATGARAKKLNVEGEAEYANKGVAYCAVCDGPLFDSKKVAIIGGGNSALEACDFMLNIASKIYIITEESDFRAHKILQERIKGHPKVEAIFNASVKRIYGDKFVTGIEYAHDGSKHMLDIGGVFVQIGRNPNTEVFESTLLIEPDGHIIIDCQTRTSECGIFACGDCASGHEYQYVIAAGQGCMALLKAARYLASKKDVCHDRMGF